jgi:hypothetical protein
MDFEDSPRSRGRSRRCDVRAMAENFDADPLSKIEADLLVLKWMVGFVLALLAAIALKLFLH